MIRAVLHSSARIAMPLLVLNYSYMRQENKILEACGSQIFVYGRHRLLSFGKDIVLPSLSILWIFPIGPYTFVVIK